MDNNFPKSKKTVHRAMKLKKCLSRINKKKNKTKQIILNFLKTKDKNKSM